MEILAGLTFGFVGSLHCIGMCGPIVLAIPPGRGHWSVFVISRLIYNFGRVVTYTLMGGVVGLLGAGVLLPMFQQDLSIIAGALIVVTVLATRFMGVSAPVPSFVSGALRHVQSKIAALLMARSTRGLFLVGILNGLLPCGFVYVAMTTAAVNSHVLGGMLFMAGFGFGTIPAMLGFAISPRIVSPKVRAKISAVLPSFTLLVGVLLILRGLNLGIPFVSPRLGEAGTNQMMEHHH